MTPRGRSLHFALALLATATTTLVTADNKDDRCPQSYSLQIPEAAVKTHTNRDKLIIAHRGASFHMPEHTIPAYRLALEVGADFVEPDLIATKDGHLVAMHTADLNVTTNVMEVFPDREPWFSPFQNRSGYWSFNFTLEEIQKLRVNQRLPRARSTAYDGMFGVPTFVEIQQLVTQWNDEQIPQILLHVDPEFTYEQKENTSASHIPMHTHYRQSAGIYAELKASPWFEADAGINLVDLFLQTIVKNRDVFSPVLECPDIFKFDEYKVPPLVVQAFEGDVLLDLGNKWKNAKDASVRRAPLPPMILLVNNKSCWEETVWFDIGDKWREYVHGIGMDKQCVPKVGDFIEDGKSFIDKAKEFKLVLHPYTERPEHEFLMEGFQDGFEETQYLLCTVGAQGVFSESVHAAVMAARMGCPEPEDAENGDDNNPDGAEVEAETEEENTSPSKSKGSDSVAVKPSLCWEDASEANWYLALASFVMGVFVTAMISMWVNRGFSCTARPPRQQQIPSDDVDSNGDIEQVPDDELL